MKEFTEYPPSADTTSTERATEQIAQTDALMKQMSQKNLNTLRELGDCLPEKDVKKLVTKTMNKSAKHKLIVESFKEHNNPSQSHTCLYHILEFFKHCLQPKL